MSLTHSISSSWLTLLLFSLGPAHICKAAGVRPDSSLTPFFVKTCNTQRCWKVTLLSANLGLALTGCNWTRKTGHLRWGDVKRNRLRRSEISPRTSRSELTRRLPVPLRFSSQPSPPDRDGKNGSSFPLAKQPHLSGLPSRVWDFFWQLAQLAAEHTRPGTGCQTARARPRQPGSPIACLDLAQQRSSKRPRLTARGPGRRLGPCHAAPRSVQPSGMQRESRNPKWHLPLKLYILLANGLLIIPQ